MEFIRLSQKIEWCEPGPFIESWSQSGIEHGFSGKEFKAPARLHHLSQVHGVLLRKAAERTAPGDLAERIKGDAIYTDSPSITVAVKTADCLPILFYHKNLVMAVHAGWRSSASGIVQKALAFYESRGIALSGVRMALGPCISPASFEVGPEVIQQFCRAASGLSREELAYCMIKGQTDRWHWDLAVYAVLVALLRGVRPTQISVMRTCTQTNPLVWHSYRREGVKAGRNWNWVAR